MDIIESVPNELDESDKNNYHLSIINNNWTYWNLTYHAI